MVLPMRGILRTLISMDLENIDTQMALFIKEIGSTTTKKVK